MESPKNKVKIDLIKILVYYDGIQIFLGYDVESFEKFYCIKAPYPIKEENNGNNSDIENLITEEYDEDIYIAFKLSIHEHSMILNEEYELSEFLNNRTHKEWYLGQFVPTYTKVLLFGHLQTTEIPKEYLPTDKIFLNNFCSLNFDEDY